ncbi:hypothetical protein PGB90_004715 [Kerria lacca]
MYPITFLTSYLLLVFCYFGAAEPPPAHGYGPPSPVQFSSNEVGSQEQYNAPLDFGNYGSFSSGSSSGYSVPNGAYVKSNPNFGSHYSGSSLSPAYKGVKGPGGVSSSYISIVHGPGSAGGPSKVRPLAAYTSPVKNTIPAINAYSGGSGSFGGSPAAFADGKFGSSNAYVSSELPNFGSAPFNKVFGSPASTYNGGFDYSGATAEYNKRYEGDASDEVGSYSSGGPSYATFTGSKPSFSSPSFSGHGSRGNAYSTSNINIGIGGKSSGHGNFHPSAFSGNFRPSGSKPYNKYGSANSAYVSGNSASSFGGNPLIGSETGYNSRALKTGYGGDTADEFNSAEDSNVFANFGDGAGFKVQSSYSTG